ncbi:MAG: class I tRNA ligase family protein [Actinomycetota bacterium]
MSRYTAISAQVDLPANERKILEFWETNSIFAQSLAAREGSPRWTFYEGPPTANGAPGTHHIEARVFKDVFPRYQTMKGNFVSRNAGWDCHGLPVEIAVEKELGFSGKGDIEKYGIDRFNQKCRESVQVHVGAFTAMTNGWVSGLISIKRIGRCHRSMSKVFGGVSKKFGKKVY